MPTRSRSFKRVCHGWISNPGLGDMHTFGCLRLFLSTVLGTVFRMLERHTSVFKRPFVSKASGELSESRFFFWQSDQSRSFLGQAISTISPGRCLAIHGSCSSSSTESQVDELGLGLGLPCKVSVSMTRDAAP